MKKIYKYPLEINDSQTIILPKESSILTVHGVRGYPYIWVWADPQEQTTEDVNIRIYHGDDDIDDSQNHTYLGSVLDYGCPVLHVFKVD